MTHAQISEKLNKGIYVSREDGETRMQFQIDGILEWSKNPKSGDKRKHLQVKKDTLNSSVCEIAIAEALGGHVNQQDFDYKNPHTYAWDVSVGGYQEDTYIEVKWMSLESDWYSFNEKLITNVEERKQYYDYLVVATPIPNLTGWDVFPRFVINPKDFTRYVKSSKYDNYKPYYYNHHNADCIVMNEEKVLQFK
jgi:hypothetical protein